MVVKAEIGNLPVGIAVYSVRVVPTILLTCRLWKIRTSGRFFIHSATLCGSWSGCQCTSLHWSSTFWIGSVRSVDSNLPRVTMPKKTLWICPVLCGLRGACYSTAALVKVIAAVLFVSIHPFSLPFFGELGLAIFSLVFFRCFFQKRTFGDERHRFY